jgi:putative DNA primase/helicase
VSGPAHLSELLSRLPGHIETSQGRQWSARCPAHEDRKPSLSVTLGEDGRILLCCHANCTAEEVVTRLGLKMRDLFPPGDGRAAGKDKLGPIVATYDYTDEAGCLLFQVTRHSPKDFRQRRRARPSDPPGKVRDGWVWGRGGVPPVLYRLPQLLNAPPDRTVFVAEGEKDVDNLVRIGLVATTNPGGAAKQRQDGRPAEKKWLPSFNPAFRGRRVVILADNDDPGRAHAATVLASLRGVAAAVAVLELPGLPKKGDVSDWLVAGGTAPDLETMAAEALARGPGSEGEGSGGRTNERPANEAERAADRAGPDRQGHTRDNTKGGSRLGLVTTRLSTLRAKPVKWLVHKRIPLGKLVLLAGDGGNGKTVWTLALAADGSRGRAALGLKYDPPGPFDTLLISCEDDFEDTVVPRLLAAGADLDRIHRVDGVDTEDGKPAPFCLLHYEQMRVALEANPDIRLVIIDPAGAYVGRSGVNDHKDSELQALLGPMAELAAEKGVTIILVKHLNKGVGIKAVQRVTGGIAYVNTVRSGFLVAPSDDDPEVKLLLPLKTNLRKQPGLKFRLASLPEDQRAAILAGLTHLDSEDRAELGEQLFHVEWLGETDVSADDALADARKKGCGPNKVTQCVEWLRGFLREYAYPSQEIVEAGNRAGFTFDNVKEAKGLLRAEGLRSSNRNTFRGVWWTGFGDAAAWQLRPEPWSGRQNSDVTPAYPPAPSSRRSPHFGSPAGVPGGTTTFLQTGERVERKEKGECGETGERRWVGVDGADYARSVFGP